MKNIFKILQCFVAAFLLSACVYAGDAEEFHKAKEAYDVGDYAYAWEKFKPLAIAGHSDSQYHMGRLYSAADSGRAQNLPVAAEWYARAAEQGHAKAQYSLGMMYQYGTGVSIDYSEAYYWLEKAATNEIGDAQLAMSKLLAEKNNPDFSVVDSYMWFLLAKFSLRNLILTKKHYETNILGYVLTPEQEDTAISLAIAQK